MEQTKILQNLITRDRISAEGIVLMENAQKAKVLHPSEASDALIEEDHKVKFSCCCPVYIGSSNCTNPKNLCDSESESCAIEEHTEPLRKKHCFKSHDNVTADIEQEAGVHHGHKFSFDMQTLAMDYPPEVIDDGNKGASSMNMNATVNLSSDDGFPFSYKRSDLLHCVYLQLVRGLGGLALQEHEDHIQGKSLCIQICSDEKCFYKMYDYPEKGKQAAILSCSWDEEDNGLANSVVTLLRGLKLDFTDSFKI